MTSVDQMQLGVISCLYIMEIMEMGKVSLLIMLPQNLDSLYIYILCCNSKNPVFSFGKTKRGLKFVDKVDDRRVDSRDHPFRVSLDLQSSHSWIQWIPLAAFPRTSKN